jgi:hypothetical protein
MVDVPEEHEHIYNTVEKTNTELVSNNVEHLDVIVDALMFGIGANLRLMADDEPIALREQSDIMIERFQQFMEAIIETSDDNWQNRTLQ